jgi:hypothetical protein
VHSIGREDERSVEDKGSRGGERVATEDAVGGRRADDAGGFLSPGSGSGSGKLPALLARGRLATTAHPVEVVLPHPAIAPLPGHVQE